MHDPAKQPSSQYSAPFFKGNFKEFTMAMDENISNPKDPNRDPLSGTPGAHPVGTGLGAAGGAVAGAAAGAMAGPVGAAVGLVAGAVAGGLGGKAAAEKVNPTAEDAYWRETYERESYFEEGRSYDDYRPAYELGWSSRATREADFNSVEPALASEWETRRGNSSLDWMQARNATRAAWDHADQTYYGVESAPANVEAVSGEAMSNGDVIDVLNDLLETSRDGEYGFRDCAEKVEASAVKQVFNSRAVDCRQAADELVQLISRYGGTPAKGGTTSAAMHRGWVSVKAAIGVNSELSMLEECERGEDTALAHYRKALKKNLPADVRSLIERQAQGAQRNHDQIRDLRDSARER